MVCAAAAALAWTAVATAQPITLQSVGVTNGRITATWSPGTAGQVIEVASRPDLGADGGFVKDNLALVDAPDDGATTWTADRHLNPGTYYVHVGGTEAGGSPIWSNVLPVVSPNTPPTLKLLSMTVRGFATARLEVCDADQGDETLLIRQERLHRGRVVAAASTTDGLQLLTDCEKTITNFDIPKKLVRRGDTYRVTIRARDENGGVSKPVVFTRRWR